MGLQNCKRKPFLSATGNTESNKIIHYRADKTEQENTESKQGINGYLIHDKGDATYC